MSDVKDKPADDNSVKNQNDASPSNPDDKKDTPSNQDDKKGDSKEGYIPKSRLDDVIKERNELREKMAEEEKAKEAERQKKLEEEGKYQELLAEREKEIESLKSIKEKYDTMSEQAEKSYTEQLSKLNEDDQAFIKDILEGKSPFQKTNMLPQLLERIKGKTDVNKQPKDSGDNSGIGKEKLLQDLEEAKKARDIGKVVKIQRELAKFNN